jgi:2-polyprenyl-3-methyl-5-hydroxy-6-metoxy-1,4-benzoquinol methylase
MKNSPFQRKAMNKMTPVDTTGKSQPSRASRMIDWDAELRDLLRLTHPDGVPNINPLTELLRDFSAMKFNLKFFGYELARTLAASLPPLASNGPFEIDLESKASTQFDLESDWSRHWSSELKIPHVFHRKIWELAFVLQAVWQTGNMAAGKRGLGFGCGEEPLPSYLASKGCRITVTDLEPDDQRAAGWAQSNELATLEKAYLGEFIEKGKFEQLVDFRHVDMTNIPDDLRDYDFCWSICAFEHLGSIEKGIQFIENAVDVLKPGGFSIHTTEFNFMHADTIDNWTTVLFQQSHFKEMERRLAEKGCQIAPLNFDVGDKPLDKFIDVAPYSHDWDFAQASIWRSGANHIKLTADGIPVTCFGLIAYKG